MLSAGKFATCFAEALALDGQGCSVARNRERQRHFRVKSTPPPLEIFWMRSSLLPSPYCFCVDIFAFDARSSSTLHQSHIQVQYPYSQKNCLEGFENCITWDTLRLHRFLDSKFEGLSFIAIVYMMLLRLTKRNF